jgi:hypothetical protein
VSGVVERMRITSAGNVGIGTTSPDQLLHIYQASSGSGNAGSGQLVLENSSTAAIQFLCPAGNASQINFGDPGGNEIGQIVYHHSGDYMKFHTASTERMRIDSSGNVGMGEGYTAGTNGFLFYRSSDAVFSRDSTALRQQIGFANPNGTVGSIRTSGSGTSFNTSSDYRLKENVVSMSGSIDRLKTLKPSRFNFIADADKTLDGFLAHEAQEVVPEAITGEKDAMTEAVLYVEGDELPEGKSIGDVKTASVPDMQGIDQSKLVPLLVGALQEAITRIETLEDA